MSLLTTRHWVIALSILAVVVIVAAALGVSDLASVQASNRYNQQRETLLADLRAAATQGYTAEDLAPITSGLKSVEAQKEPALLVTSPAFYSRRADQVAALDAQLKVRKKAVLALGNVGAADPAAIPALIEVLKDKDPLIRREAVLALLKNAPDAWDAVPALEGLLTDKDPRVRNYAEKALEKIRQGE